ncbi:DegT/DnrJ/EryC1/StrS family aminotransferase [Pelagicoccus mobilis]|uniref:DegT/DnrJ/EryC1/StrS family aminotransferase n=1 Tax=Pelagicoccus mobilis TaxID=415221 RepID=A0A934VU74_9BACT|nr:DegT/DnrJ/EryC1/StrS family aminotransferase [Pelagicoccus mobilis]MBK1880463.1 DegT/DnrJ/EryC1/StrS family aminotransferase [Pelagicoccus mobilis]
MELRPYPRPIPYGRQCIDDADIDLVVETLRSDFVAQGPQVQAFESELCEQTGVKYAVAVSSGTAALHLSCLGLGLGVGDLGLVPGITFAATANCLRYVGADVGFVDVDPLTGLVSAKSFSKRGKAFFPVSYSGAVPDLEGISKAAAGAGAFVIEDAAHSVGATYGSGSKSASCEHTDAAILSFHPVKHVCAGEGGAVLTNDKVLADRVRRLRTHGVEQGERWLYDQTELGFHYRMTDLQAALGRSQLAKLPDFVERRRVLASRYQEAFDEEPFEGRIRTAPIDAGSAVHLFVVHFANEQERAKAYDFFHQHNVRVQVHYLPVYRHRYYGDDGHEAMPGCEAFYATCLSLPLYPALGDEEQEFVIQCLKAFLLENEG